MLEKIKSHANLPIFYPEKGTVLGFLHGKRVYDMSGVAPECFGSITSLMRQPDIRSRIEALQDTVLKQASFSYDELDRMPSLQLPHLLAPLDTQEVWGAGVTYSRSRSARMEESRTAADVYDRVYDAG